MTIFFINKTITSITSLDYHKFMKTNQCIKYNSKNKQYKINNIKKLRKLYKLMTKLPDETIKQQVILQYFQTNTHFANERMLIKIWTFETMYSTTHVK